MQTIETTTSATTPLADDYDVVIVGARAAGAATALQLARAGVRVAAVDKAGYGSDTLSTHMLARAGVVLLSHWGVLDDIRRAGTPVGRQMVFNYGDQRVPIDVAPDGDVDGLYSPRRTVLDRILVDAAVEAGATVRHRTPVTRVVSDRRGRAVGIEVDDGGRLRTIGARFVIGADGMRSRIADQLGAVTLRAETGPGNGVVYAYFRDVADPSVIETDHRPGRAAGVIPTNDGETCVWAGVRGDRFRTEVADGADAFFARAVAAQPGLARRLEGATRTTRFRSFPGAPGFLRQSWGCGWALVGDSAYYKDPVSAHGITDALIGAELLSAALVEVLHDDVLDVVALGRYQQTRNRLAAPMIAAVAKAASMDDDVSRVAAGFKEMSAAMRLENDYLQHRRTPAVTAAA